MCSAMPLRIALIGSSALAGRSLRAPGRGLRRRGRRWRRCRRGGCAPARRAARPGAARPARRDSMKARMSFFVTRPPWPVPCTWPTSTPCSAAIRATTGETNVFAVAARRRCRPAAARGRAARLRGAGVSALEAAAARRRRPRRSRAPAARARGSARRRPAPSGAITASFVPTSTVSPSWTRIFWTTPVPGSAPRCRPCRSRSRAAARRPRSARPRCFSHFVIVPSETDTPIWGMTTSIAVPSPSVRRQLPEPGDDVLDLRDVGLLERRRERHRACRAR